MKAIILLCLGFIAFAPTVSGQSNGNSTPQKLYCLTKSKTDSLILDESKIEFTTTRTDALSANPCLVLKAENHFSFYCHIGEKRDSVLNQVTKIYEKRIVTAYNEMKGNYLSDNDFKQISLTLENGKKYTYTVVAENDKVVFTKQ